MVRIVNVIFGGSYESGVTYSAAKRNLRRVHNVSGRAENTYSVEEELEVTFNFKESIDVLNPHHNALVISLGIANCLIKRILVDNGSSINIIYMDTMREMQVVENKIARQAMVSVGFSGEAKHIIGEIELPVWAEGVNKYTRFRVLEGPSSFNAILG